MKKENQILKKFHNKLNVEAILRSLIWGVIIGFSVSLVTATVSYIFDIGIVLIAIIAGLAICVIVTTCFYLLRYKPNKIDLASRVDILGLQERVLTMTELQEDDSYIAKLQRQDAVTFIEKVQNQKIKFIFDKTLLIVSCCILAVSGAITSIVMASEAGYLPTFSEVVDNLYDSFSSDEYSLAYIADGGGMVLGSIYQVVARGSNGEEVVAMADDGYEFSEWSDGYSEPIRKDFTIRNDIEVYALFSVITISDGDAGNMDDSLTIPDMDMDGEAPDGMTGSAGNEYVDNNQVLNGETHYTDVYDSYKQDAMDDLDSNIVPDDVKDFLETYLDSL